MRNNTFKKLSVYFIGVLFFYCKTDAQSITGQVIDSLSQNPIPYVTIYWKNNSKIATYSNSNGVFKIQNIKNDTLCITNIGYYNKQIINTEATDKVSVQLVKKINNLPTVIVSNAKKKKKEIGYHKDKKQATFKGTFGAKTLLLIKPTENFYYSKITNLLYKIAFSITIKNAKDSFYIRKYHSGKVRILLYANDSTDTKYLTESLIPEDIIVDVPNKTHTLRVDISKYRIFIPSNGVYVGLEWLGEDFTDGKLLNISPGYWCSFKNNSDFKTISLFFDNKIQKSNKYVNIQLAPAPNFGLELEY